jgi:riboflavin kinase/FMN adenylyltransferase
MTADAAFGYERAGTPQALAELGREAGFAVAVVDSLVLDGEQVRSSEIRRRISTGDLAGAERMLGRAPAVTGRVAEVGEGPAGLTFDLPVVLPPEGRYRVSIEEPWTVAGRGQGPIRAGAAVVGAAPSVSLEAVEGVPPRSGESVRVVFRARAGDDEAA